MKNIHIDSQNTWHVNIDGEDYQYEADDWEVKARGVIKNHLVNFIVYARDAPMAVEMLQEIGVTSIEIKGVSPAQEYKISLIYSVVTEEGSINGDFERREFLNLLGEEMGMEDPELKECIPNIIRIAERLGIQGNLCSGEPLRLGNYQKMNGEYVTHELHIKDDENTFPLEVVSLALPQGGNVFCQSVVMLSIDEAKKTLLSENEKEFLTAHGGTLIRATNQEKDLISVFIEKIQNLDTENRFIAIVERSKNLLDALEKPDSMDLIDEGAETVNDLMDVLDTFAPEGYYFGVTEGDSSDYGFWEIPEANNEETEATVSMSTQ